MMIACSYLLKNNLVHSNIPSTTIMLFCPFLLFKIVLMLISLFKPEGIMIVYSM